MSVSEKIQDLALQIATEYPNTWRGLFAGYFLMTVLFVGLHVAIQDDYNYEWITYGVGYCILTICWVIFRTGVQKNNDSQTGIVIALYGRDFQARELRRKFICELQKNINDASLGDVFNIIPLKNHHAEKIKTKTDICEINKKINGHFYLYGDIQKERDGDTYKYFINLDGYIVHWPIPIPTSQELTVDFRNVLPKEINFSELFGYRCIKLTSKIAYLATKYIVGVASFVSANPFLAYRLHKDLENEFHEYERIDAEMNGKGEISTLDKKYLKKLRQKLQLIISNEALVIARVFQINQRIPECIEYLDIAQQKNANNYSLWLLKAILAFSVENDPLSAIGYVKKAKRFAGTTHEWRYSMAFLLFWNEKYEDAYKECQKIATHTYRGENTTVNEVENFNLDILGRRNDKPQLYFWIGYIVHKKRMDSVLAQQYFESFLRTNINSPNIFLETKARSFLTEIAQNI